MKIKTFILTFLMMMSCSILFGQGESTGLAKSESKLKQFLYNENYGTITIGDDFSVSSTIEIPKGRKITIDLNGHKLTTNADIYIFKNFGQLTITDNSTDGKGTISSLGIYNGKPQTRTNTDDIDYTAQLTIKGGVFENISPDGGAAIYNHLGVIDIQGGEFYGEYSAITNFGLATIANAYIECLNRDNDAAAIINDFEIEYGNNVNVVGRYTESETASIIDGKATYLFAELNGTKYTSLQAALDACTTGDNTINLLFHNSDNATVSQKEGVNITIDGNGYKGKQFEYTGTICVHGNSRHTGTETLTIQDINFTTENDSHDFILCDFRKCNEAAQEVVRYAHNVTVQNCNFNAKETSTAVVALRFRQSYNINVIGSTFTNLHSAMWATGTSGIAFDNITATKCKEGGISVGTSTSVSVKNSTIAGAKYGVRADGSGEYSLNVENSTLSAEVPVIVRNTTGDYNLTVKEDATLASTNGGPQVVVTAGKDNEAYVTPTSDVNVTLDNVTSTFGLTAKIGNAFYATLQDAVDNANDNNEIVLVSDVTEDVTITQKADLDLIINGDGKKFTGVMTVFGDARHDGNETLTIKDIDFVAKNGSDACILSPDRNAQNPARYSYSHNVTVENCSFTDVDGNVNCAAIRHGDGGDVNWTLNKCTVDNTMHSLIQTNNVNGKLVIAECTVNSKNGVNLNSCTNVEMTGCNFDVQGYALRSGVKTGGNLGVAKTYVLENNTLKSACGDGDAVIMFRASSVDANFSMEKNVVSGTTHISGNTAATKIAADANYWDGKEAPVVAEGSTPIIVNSYYKDEALTNLIRIPMGSDFTAYTREDAIWGEVGGNAIASFVIKVLDADGNVMGTTSLNNVNNIIDGSVYVTWSLKLNAESNQDEYWTMQWTTAPSIDNMPAKVELYVDGTRVGGGDVVLNAPDNLSKINAANIDADGKILAYRTNLTEAVNNGDNVAILTADTYNLPTGKNLTITGAVDGVQFGPIGTPRMDGNYTFNNVTFNYAADSHYKGLQYAGDMVYNNCTFNGQVFLYGESETFNGCTFNQENSGYYNVWTYGAKEVAFNECTFNSAGKSVLVYNEGACATDLTVTDTKFIASATVDDKAAIEIDCSLMPKGTSIVIDGVEEGKTTATGFGTNTKSGSSLWNDKKVVEGAPNGGTSSKVIIDDVVVKEPALMNLAGEGTEENPYLISNLEDLIWFRYQVNAGNNYAGKYIKVTATEIDLNNEEWTPIAYMGKTFKGNFDGNNVTVKNLKITKALTNSAENNGIGFFGRTDSPATIENIIIENVDITGSLYVGAIVGFGYTGKHVKGCTVKGNIAIDAWWYAGVIGGNGYMNLVDDCHVIGNNGSYIKGNDGSYIGGIWGFRGEGNNKITNCTVTNLNIIGVDRVGGICGIGHYGNTISGCDAEDVTVTATDPDATTIGLLVGATQGNDISGQGPTIFEDNDASGITAQIDNGDGTYTEVTNLYGTNINGSTPVTNYVAQIVGGTQYATLAEAVAAAVNNDVITLLPTNAPIAMNASLYGKNVTITGTATVDWSKGFLFVGRGGEGDATLTFDNANLTSASNSSSYGIHVSGREKNTDNKYDGTLVIKNSTIELDYLIDRGTITLDEGATLTVTNGFGIAGRPGTETESGEDATATITLNNESKVVVNNHNGMGLGIAATQLEGFGIMNINSGSTFETTQSFTVTAKGTMNVNGGNVKVVGTLTNAGTVYVTGEANLDANVTGNGWFYMNGVTLDANTKLLGAKVRFASGTNNIDGSTIDDGFFQVGIGAYNGTDANVDTENGVVVNVKNAVIGANGDTYAGWAGTGFYDTDDEKAAAMKNAKYVLNIENSIAEFGYLHVSNDGELNVKGDAAEKKWYNNSNYSFYAGDFIINGTATFDATDVLAFYTKVSCDNGTDKPGTLNIVNGTDYEAERHNGAVDGLNFDIRKTGIVNVAEGANLHVGEPASIAADATMNIAGTATVLGELTNNGTINFTSETATLTVPTTGLTVNNATGNNDIKVVYENGAYVVTAKHYVAQVKDTDNNVRVKFETFAEALDAVENGETIELLGTEGSEISKEIDFTEDIEFTITGNAPNYGLPIVTFQNATVNIKDATILIPELDARQDATINVINSTVYDAGGNSIAKSYYNGAINISGTSEVYMMQVTTMGYINISGTAKLHATWQTNVYGNGLVTIKNNATFNTAALHLTGQAYSGRDNTDAERAGKPAEILVDGANLTVGKVLSSNNADYSYNSSKGINVGTVEGKSAILNIMNGGNVNIYMANGETANIGAGGTVNIDASTFNVVCRAENGTATLANNGTVNVTDESTLNIQTLTGESIKFLDGAIINNSTVGGNVFVAGAVTFRGDNTFAMLYDFGTLTNNYGTTAPMKWNVEKGASVTLTEKARYGLGYGDEVTVIGNIENALTARENLSDDDRSLFMHGLVAQESSGWNCNSKLTVKNAYVVLGSNNSFGNKPGNYGGTYKFDFNNSVVDGSRITFYEANSQTEFTLTNSDVRIGTFMTRDADSKFILTGSKVLSTAETNGNDEGNYNAGELVLNNSSLTYNAAFTNTGVLNIGENSNVKATTVINNGTINFTSLTSILETATEGLVITLDSNYPDHKVVYKDGKYQVVEKDYVAQIGEQGYETLAEAATAAQDGETIQLLWEEGDAAISMAATFVGNKTVTIKGTANVDWSKGFFFVGRNGEGDGKVIFDNANLTSVSNSSAYGFNVSGGKLNDNTTNNGIVEIKNSTIVLDYMLNKNVITLDNSTLTVKNGFSVTGREASESATGEDATATMTLSNNSKVVVNNMNGMGIGHEAYGIMNIDATSTFETTLYFNISAKGTMNVNGGNVKVAGTLDNNGTMNVAAESNVKVTGNLNVNGTLNSAGNITANIVKAATATIQLTGGIYTTEPQDSWCAESYGVFPYDETSWVVREISGEQTFELTAGWNWVSSYITEFDGPTGLAMLQEGLDTCGIQIKNDNYTSNYRNNGWSGRLTSVSVKEMYKVNMSDDVNFKFEGGFVNYDECEIVLYPGWNYIGYPVNVETNLADALVILSADGQEESNGAKEGDVIKSQQGTATYIGSSTWLFSNPFNLVPGEGYMYYNTSDEVKVLRYTTKEATTTSEANTRSSKHWTVDATQYPSNMTMIAMTDVEGGNYEVAAFVNGEVRGSSRPVYVESLDAYIIILTISGDDVEEMTFKCYDLTTGEEVEFSNRINYSNDAIVGSIYEPYMLTRGTTGIGEAAMSNVNIYPNPTTTGTGINLQATCDKVEVFNALGVKVVEYQNVDSIDALETAGIYVIRITNNGNVQNCRLVVK